MSQRVIRVQELIHRELSALMQREIDFGGVLVTIQDVTVTPDFRHANIYIGIIGVAQDERWVLETLEKHRGKFQAKMSKRVILKNTPQLHFKVDHSIERGVQVLQAIDDLPPIAADHADHDPVDEKSETPNT